MDSSVIFLVVLALWAAYLVPHWLRRREHLSASRSVDRFSAAMRVLARRPAPGERDGRPRTSAPVLLVPARPVAALPAGTSEDAATDDAAGARDPAQPRALAPVAHPTPRPRRAGTRTPAGTLTRTLTRTLGALLLVAVLAAAASGVLSVLRLAPVWAAAPPAGLALVLVAALRTSARRRRRAARSTVPAHAVTVVAPDEVVASADGPEPVAREELFDEQVHAAREEQARIRRLAEEALRAADVPYREPEPGEWTPVAVPLPAYLLKPHARPSWQPAPAPSAPAVRALVVADVDEDDIPTYAPPVRRATGA